jgi:uncharacterized protein YsxB (DUF464 family)
MIRIQIERAPEGELGRILITGHAHFAEHGQDIVCAAVSAIAICQVNAIEMLTGITIHQPDDGDGKVDCQIPRDLNSHVREKVLLLCEAMVLSLKQVADAYPNYVKWIELKKG